MELIDDDLNFFVYTDVGHKRDGVWTTTGNPWQKGVCIMQFNRTCPAEKTQVRLRGTATEAKQKNNPVHDSWRQTKANEANQTMTNKS